MRISSPSPFIGLLLSTWQVVIERKIKKKKKQAIKFFFITPYVFVNLFRVLLERRKWEESGHYIAPAPKSKIENIC